MNIMTMLKPIMKSLITKPATEMYPVIKKQYKDRTRGKIEIDISKCIFCNICGRRCPTNAIQVNKNDKCWAIDRLRCIACSNCVDACPKKCLTMLNQYTLPTSVKEIDKFIQPTQLAVEE